MTRAIWTASRSLPSWIWCRQSDRAARKIRRKRFLEQEGGLGKRFDPLLGQDGRHLVTEGEDAGGLQAEDACATGNERFQRLDRAQGFLARVLDLSRREIGPSAAERPSGGATVWMR